METKTLTPRKSFSHIGLSVFVFLLVACMLQVAINAVVTGLSPAGNDIYLDHPWLSWVVSFVPMYLIALPIGVAMMRRLPVEENVRRTDMSFGRLLKIFVICVPVMYAGNAVGTLLSMLISGGSAVNPVVSMASSDSPLRVLVMVILAPLVEEFVFRRQLIDRLGKYGEGVAIVFSGVTFGLFHGNLFQFFYACALGMIFAYVYIRTRKLRYTVILHAVINFMGSVLGPWAVSQAAGATGEMNTADLVAMDEEALMQIAPGIMIFGLYVLLLIGLIIAGIVLIITNRKKVELYPTAEELPRGTVFKTVYVNVGVILLALLCLGLTAMNMFS